jgi:hypothetical protein
MSIKNGDRSRAQRLRAQRDKLRIKTRALRSEGAAKPSKAKADK